MDVMLWAAQAVGAVGILIGIIAASRKNDTALITGFMTSNVFVAAQMVMTGAYASAGATLVGTLRLYVARQSTSTPMMLFFILLLIAQWCWLGTAVELPLVIGAIISTYGYFKLCGASLRYALVVMNLFWVPVMVYQTIYIPALYYTVNSLLMLRTAWRESAGKEKVA